MYRIVTKEALKPTVILYEIEAPMVAKKAQPGQFIILRVDENGERIPITIHDYDREKGTVTIIVQTVGATTEKLSHKQQGDYLHDFVGPLGKPTETEGKKKVCVVGGGVGCAIAYPVLKKFHDCGAEVHAVVGFKSKDVVILEDKFKAVSSVMKVCTDDGSYGQKGLVTEALKELLTAAAQTRAEEIAVVNSHVRPDGSKCFTVLKDYGVTDTPTGENAAWGSVSPEEVVNAWMNSEGHRANILNPEARKMSVGYYYNSNSTWGHQWIQIFTK